MTIVASSYPTSHKTVSWLVGWGQRKILAATKNDKNNLVEYKLSYKRQHYSYRAHVFWQAPLTPLLLDSLYRQMVFQYLLTVITSNRIMLIHTNFHENQSTGLQFEMTHAHGDLMLSPHSFSFLQKERKIMTNNWRGMSYIYIFLFFFFLCTSYTSDLF